MNRQFDWDYLAGVRISGVNAPPSDNQNRAFTQAGINIDIHVDICILGLGKVQSLNSDYLYSIGKLTRD